MSYESIQVTEMAPACGAIIDGVDLSKELTNRQFDEIYDAVVDRVVVVFRGQELTPEQHVALARRFEDAGVAALIYTDIERDGAMQGPNVAATVALAKSVSIPVIASGGVSSLADVEAFLPHQADGIAGVISGRAIYDGRIDLAAALKRLRETG